MSELTRAQEVVLVVVALRPMLSTRTVARYLYGSRRRAGTAVRILRALERRGLVALVPNDATGTGRCRRADEATRRRVAVARDLRPALAELWAPTNDGRRRARHSRLDSVLSAVAAVLPW
jgi:DNA-binding MarR family transcriptional regulator